MDEHKQIEVGCYCQELLMDARFNELVQICESNFALGMLSADSAEKREEIHRTYTGLNEFLSLMQQFVSVKDQIVAKNESE